MQSRLIKLVLSPRLWLSIGVFSVGMSIVVGYHQDQMVAENALAQKVALPEKVMVQHFSTSMHQNILNEVRLVAEAGVDRIVRVDVGNETVRRMVDIVPIYPVSRLSLPLARSILEERRKPTSRDQVSRLAESRRALALVETRPVGLMIFETGDTQTTPNLDHLKIGEGASGPLISLTGVHIGASLILERAAGPLAENGVRLIKGAVVVAPHPQGLRSGPGITDYSSARSALAWVSALTMAFGFALLFSLVPSFGRSKKIEGPYEVKAVGAFPEVDPFQPIAAQNDLLSGEGGDGGVRRLSRMLIAVVTKNRR